MNGKKYIDSRRWKYQVMSGIGENTYKARYQRPEKQGDVGWKGLDKAEMVLARPEAEWREAKSMKRLTSDNTFEMNMLQLALNQVYIGKDGWTQYVEGPDREYSVCDLARAVSETLGVELPMLSDEALSDLLLDWLQYGAEEPEGVVAILYRALCAMAEVRAKLFRYEDTGLEPEEIEAAKERIDIKFALWVSKTWGLADGRLNEILKAEKDGRLVVLPCKTGSTVYAITSPSNIDGIESEEAIDIFECTVESVTFYSNGSAQFRLYYHGVFVASFATVDDFGKTVFLTREEAEAAMKKREED